MINNTTKHYSQSAVYALFASFTALSLIFTTFFLAEPTISFGQIEEEFLVTQQITGESSFKTVSDVTMAGSIAGVTGGTANGSTDFVVLTNDPDGYTVNLKFVYSGTEAMEGDTTGSAALRDYDNTGEPTFNFNASTSSQFAYTVTSDQGGDTDLSFLDNGSACGIAGADNGLCWKEPTVAGFDIVDTTNSAVNGATSTIAFRIVVPGGAVPAPEADFYTATATLTLVVK